VERIIRIFEQTRLPTNIRLKPTQRARLFSAMQLDKKVTGGEIKFVLARKIGHAVWGQRAPLELLSRVLDESESKTA
jgi:3-dehydroquinate synthetase